MIHSFGKPLTKLRIIILLMLLPVIVKSIILPGMGFSVLMVVAFAGEVLVLISFNKVVLSYPAFFVLVNSLVMLLSNRLLKIETNTQDYLNLMAKFLSITLLFSVMKTISVSWSDIKNFSKFMVWLSVVACVFNIIANRSSFNSSLFQMSAYQISFRSFFLNRNQFGMFLVVSLFFVELFFEKNNWLKYGIITLILANLFLTLSRGSMISALLFLFLDYAFYRRLNPKKIIVPSIFIGIALLWLFQQDGFSAFFQNSVIRSEQGNTGRFSIWGHGFNVLTKTNFLNGCGFYSGVDLAHNAGMGVDQFHSLYIDSLVDGGILYLIIVLGLYFDVYKQCRNKILDKRILSAYRAFAIAVLVMASNESVSFFSVGWVDTLFTISCFSFPLLLSNIDWKSQMTKI